MGNENEQYNENDMNSQNNQSLSLFEDSSEFNPDIPIIPQNNLVLEINREIPNVETKNKKGLFTTNKRGRKKKTDSETDVDSNCSHNKYSLDNIQKKIAGHFSSFITDYSNAILKHFGIYENFIKRDHKNKKYLNKSEMSLLKKTKIWELLSQDISPKYRKHQKNENKNLLNEAIKNPIINQLFSESYISLFKNVYIKNLKNINLNDNEKDVDIILYEVKTFEDLVNNNVKDKQNNSSDELLDNYYKKRLLDCVNKRFLKDEKSNKSD